MLRRALKTRRGVTWQGRFEGTAPEPRPHLVGGHMPGALNLPFTALVKVSAPLVILLDALWQQQQLFIGIRLHPYLPVPNQEDDVTTFKSPAEIRDAFKDAGIVFGSRIVLTCGSGVSAAVLALGLHLLGADFEQTPVYDGSWSEWGDPARADLPKIK